jgi:hypothetical protein
MRSCPALQFPGITQNKWIALKAAALSKAGFDVPSDSGTYNVHGFNATWDYSAEVLTVQVLDMPLWFSCDFINSQISHAVANL